MLLKFNTKIVLALPHQASIECDTNSQFKNKKHVMYARMTLGMALLFTSLFIHLMYHHYLVGQEVKLDVYTIFVPK